MEYNIKYNIGKAKYVVNYHRKGNKHKDGSKFFDIAIFKNKKDLNEFIDKLESLIKMEKSAFEEIKESIIESIGFSRTLTDLKERFEHILQEYDLEEEELK